MTTTFEILEHYAHNSGFLREAKDAILAPEVNTRTQWKFNGFGQIEGKVDQWGICIGTKTDFYPEPLIDKFVLMTEDEYFILDKSGALTKNLFSFESLNILASIVAITLNKVTDLISNKKVDDNLISGFTTNRKFTQSDISTEDVKYFLELCIKNQ